MGSGLFKVGDFVKPRASSSLKQIVYEVIYARESLDEQNGLCLLRIDKFTPETFQEFSKNLEPAVRCFANDCKLAPIEHSVYCDEHKDGPRFVCETQNCENESFYMRVIGSNSHDVDDFGVVGEENENSYESESVSPVKCATCERVAKDLQPEKPLEW